MTPSDVSVGRTVMVTLAPAGGRAPEPLHPRSEVLVWRDSTTREFLLRQGRVTFAVREHPPEGRLLADICDQNLPTVAWLLDHRQTPEGDRLRVQFHRFQGEEVRFTALAIGVTPDALTAARRVNPEIRHPDQLIGWLTDECLLTDGLTGLGTRSFLAPLGGQERHSDDGFMLYGRSVRVSVGRDRTAGRPESLFVRTVTRSRAGLSEGQIRLAVGDIRFCDWSPDAELRALDQAQLAALATSDESFLRAWERYGRIEERALLEQLLGVGALAYESVELLPDGDVQFHLVEALGDGACELLGAGDELEAAGERPDLTAAHLRCAALLTTRERPNEALPDRPGLRGQFVGTLSAAPRAGDRAVVLAGDVSEVPEQGWLFVSVFGSTVVQERRENARRDIQLGRCWLPLGLLLEGGDIRAARPGTHTPRTDRVFSKVFVTRDGRPNPPTDRQVDAIRAAINTPDVALIQGPPGTGKTTVIRAILERLNQIDGGTDGLTGRFLVTGFQHDAVENAIAKLDVNALPPVKFGGRGGADGFADARLRVDDWRMSTAERLRPPVAAPSDAGRRVKELLHSYVTAPGDPTATANLLDTVASLVRGRVPPRFPQELTELAEDLRRTVADWRRGGGDRIRAARAARALRIDPRAFADDGRVTSATLAESLRGELGEEDAELLARATAWRGDTAPPFLAGLADLRVRLLSKYGPPPPASAVPRVRRDVADLLARVRDEVEDVVRRSVGGPDAVTADYVEQLETNPDLVARTIMDYTTVFAATCQQAASKRVAEAKRGTGVVYDTVLVDEAARANPLDLFIPMAQARRRVILVGDHRQLPHIVDTQLQRELESDLAEDGEAAAAKTSRAIEESLFERLFRQLEQRQRHDHIPRAVTLNVQYRMHPSLGTFVSDNFYPPEERFGNGFTPERFAHALPGYEGKFAAWVSVPREAGRESPGQSKSRPVEARLLARELKRLIDSEAGRKMSFGVITFYAAQVQEISRHLAVEGLMADGGRDGYRVSDAYTELKLPGGRVEEWLRVGTVDAFQGKEFDVVFLSMVRSGREPAGTEKERRQKFGHLMSPNRLCVGMSRQKSLLIVVGDDGMLDAPDAAAVPQLVAYLKLCREEGVVHRAARGGSGPDDWQVETTRGRA